MVYYESDRDSNKPIIKYSEIVKPEVDFTMQGVIQNYSEVFDTTYLSIFLKSALIGLATTFICLAISCNLKS